MTKVTNLSKAIEIVKASASKAEALEKMVTDLGVSRSNAFVYYTKATKGVAKPAKAAAVAKVKESIQGTSVAKKATKIAEIDAVIANLRKTGAKVANPFAQLGA